MSQPQQDGYCPGHKLTAQVPRTMREAPVDLALTEETPGDQQTWPQAPPALGHADDGMPTQAPRPAGRSCNTILNHCHHHIIHLSKLRNYLLFVYWHVKILIMFNKIEEICN